MRKIAPSLVIALRKMLNRPTLILFSLFLVATLLGNKTLIPGSNFHGSEKKIVRTANMPGNPIRRLRQKTSNTNKFFSTPSNVLVNNNDGAGTTSNFTQNTSSILAFGSNVVIAFDDAGSYDGFTPHFTGWAYSTDGGTTFTDGGKLPVSAIGDAGETVLARNSTTGRIYLGTIGFNSPQTIQVFRSDDNAVTWMTPVVGTPGGDTEDKPWIAVDNFAGAGNGNVYVMSRSFGGASNAMHFFRSTDDGSTFGPSGGIVIAVDQSLQGAYLVVGPDHSVYAFYYETGFIKMRKSTDQGQSFGAEVTVVNDLLSSGGPNGDLGLTGIRNGTSSASSFRSNEFVEADVNPTNGNLYIVYDNKGTGSDKADVFFKSSTDGGSTWSSAIKVNDDATSTDQWRPTVAVMPDGSGLGVFYFSRQEDPSNNNLFKYYGRLAAIAGSTITFQPSFAVSDVASYPEFGRDAIVNSTYMGDYNQAVATDGGFYVSWGDNRSDLAGGAPRKDPNVYFSQVPPLTPVPILDFNSASLSGGNGNNTIEPGESVDINVSLKNIGAASATGITSTLTTATPGVNITQASSDYADIAAAGSGTNLTGFSITTTSDLVCGLPVQFTLTVNYGDSTKKLNFSVPTFEGLGTALTFSNPTTSSIADVGTTNIPISVSGFNSVIGKVSISFYLTHPSDQDLSISLISPDGTSVALSNNKGGANYGTSCQAQTVFDDNAPLSIDGGIAPFVGTFQPETPLSAFIGKSGSSVNGSWTLQINDNGFQTLGTFHCATLTLTPLTCPNPVAAAGSTVVSENCSPANGAIDPGETVTVSFCLQNYFGITNTSNVVATLQNSGGVTNASGPQTYGELTPGGASVCKNFTFTANGNCGDMIKATLHLQDGAQDLGSVDYSLQLGTIVINTTSFSNNSAITVPASGTTTGPSDPYPSTISVSGLTGIITKLTVTLNDLNHTFPKDVDMLLVSPSGKKFVMLSNVIGSSDWVNINYTLDDDASSSIAGNALPFSGTFKPTDYGSGDVFSSPAPAGPYDEAAPAGTATFASVFNGLDPNGTWSLYVVDDEAVDVGNIAGGWALNITTSTLTCCNAPCTLSCPDDTTVTNDPGQCGAIVNYNLPQTTGSCGTVTSSPLRGSLFPFGTTTVNVSTTSGSTCSFTVTVVPADATACAITGRTSICDVETVQWCAPAGMTNYEWRDPVGVKSFSQCINVHTPGVYTVSFTDGNGCRKTCSRELHVSTCPVACSYTQGFYSNSKGKACSGSLSNNSASQLMLNAFGATTSTIFGSVANNRFFTLYKTDITDGDIFKMLPGSGNSQALGMAAGGSTYSNKNTWYLVPIPTGGSQKGKINNQLLSQTITLWFNIRTSNTLASVDLTNDTLVTNMQTTCGSGIPTASSSKFGLPHDVVLYLNGPNGYANNVSGLFQLANDVLGGINTSVNPLAVQYAVAAINNAFDGCRVLTTTIPYGQSTNVITKAALKVINEQSNIPASLQVTAYPNPYNDQFNVKINSPVSGMAIIEFFSANGMKVFEQKKYIVDKIVNVVPYLGPRHSGLLMYKISIGNYDTGGFVIGIH